MWPKVKLQAEEQCWSFALLHIDTSETVSKMKYHSDPGTIKGCPVAVRSDPAEAKINLETIPRFRQETMKD